MIVLTRLKGQRFILNAELIRTVEKTPDTMITLLNGDRIIVQESMDEVVRRSVEYGRQLRCFAPPNMADLTEESS